MPLCSICLDELKAPVSISCGHVFCNECLFGAVTTKKSYTNLHSCPTCRAPFSIVNIDPALIPAHLRPYIVPSVRKLYLEESPEGSSSPSTSSFTLSDYQRLTAENNILKTNCCIWRRRAETHAAATFGLLNVTRMAKQRVVQLEHEKEELERSCSVLKRKLEAEEALLNSQLGSLHKLSESTSPSHPSASAYLFASELPCPEQWLDISTSATTPIENHDHHEVLSPAPKRQRKAKAVPSAPLRRSRRRRSSYTRS